MANACESPSVTPFKQLTIREIFTKIPVRDAFKLLFNRILNEEKPLLQEAAKKEVAFCVLKVVKEMSPGDAHFVQKQLFDYNAAGLKARLIGWNANENKAEVIEDPTPLSVYKLGFAGGFFWAAVFKGDGAVGAASLFANLESRGKFFQSISLSEIKPEDLETKEKAAVSRQVVENALETAKLRAFNMLGENKFKYISENRAGLTREKLKPEEQDAFNAAKATNFVSENPFVREQDKKELTAFLNAVRLETLSMF